MNPSTHLIIVADLGQLKAYRVDTVTGTDPHETMQVSHANRTGTEKTATNLELFRDIDYVGAHTRTSESMSDKSGRFGSDSGEAHNSSLEKERQGLRQIASDIGSIVTEAGAQTWHLAFPKAHNNTLVEMLTPDIRNKMVQCLAADLTKVDKSELIGHFA